MLIPEVLQLACVPSSGLSSTGHPPVRSAGSIGCARHSSAQGPLPPPIAGTILRPCHFCPISPGQLLSCSLEMLSAGLHGLGGLSGRHLPDMASAGWVLDWYRDSCENFDFINLHKKTLGSAKLRDK